MSNQGSKAGSIDDIVLKIKYRCGDSKTKNINTYSFIPRLSCEDYSIFKTYQESDFEPFQSIPLPAKSRLTRYIVFIPSNDGFSPSIGSMEINIFRRNFNCNEWNKSHESLNIDVDEDTVTVWKGQSGKGVIIEVTNTIQQLPASPDPAKPGLRELLTKLQAEIEKFSEIPQKNKDGALKRLKELAEIAENPNEEEKDKAQNILAWFATKLPMATAAAEGLKALIGSVSEIFPD